MGIYIQCFTDTGATPQEQLGARIVESAERWARKRGLHELFFGVAGDTSATISFFPPSGTIRFDIARGRITFDAKTSIAGPGFHVATVELCDHLATDLNLRWRWDAGGDQTGYAKHRDFSQLETEFTEQFLAFCGFYETASGNGFALNLTEGLAIEGFDAVAAPMGPLPFAFFRNALHDTEHLVENARRVFPWWNKTADHEFWMNALRAMLWAEVEWRAPRTPWETFVLGAVNAAASHLDLGHEPELAAALHELNELSSSADVFVAPPAQGVGYRRGKRVFHLTGPWRINLPAYYIEQPEDEGTTICLWFGSEEIRASSWVHQDKQKMSWHKTFSDCQEYASSTCRYRVSATQASTGDTTGFYASADFHATNNPAKGHLLHLTFFSFDPKAHERLSELAKEVWADPPRELPAKVLDA